MCAEVVIRPMRSEDVPEVVAIEQAVYTTPWSEGAFQTEIADNRLAVYIVAAIEDKVVGYAGMWVFLGEAHVTTIAVHPEYQRRGIGGALLTELLAKAYGRGATQMTLEVRPSNVVARTLYEKLGFSAHGIRRGYYTDTKEDAIIMWNEDITPFVRDRSKECLT